MTSCQRHKMRYSNTGHYLVNQAETFHLEQFYFGNPFLKKVIIMMIIKKGKKFIRSVNIPYVFSDGFLMAPNLANMTSILDFVSNLILFYQEFGNAMPALFFFWFNLAIVFGPKKNCLFIPFLLVEKFSRTF